MASTSTRNSGRTRPATITVELAGGLLGKLQLEEQAQMLSFVSAFEILAVIFLALIPLLFFMRRTGV